MRSVGGIVERVVSWQNLRLAVRNALRGCRRTTQAREYLLHLEDELARLRRELESGRLVVGAFHRFIVYDPKRREISAPHFRERVLHHAIMNACAPELDARLISDCYACRIGKGHKAAVQRALGYAAQHPHFLKLDISRYFDSISHRIALGQLAGVFRERRVLDWFEQIVATYQTRPGTGLPIGSLISQHVANFHLAPLDRFVKQALRFKHYLRYMDDFALWANGTPCLFDARDRLAEFLATNLCLALKPHPFVNQTGHGMDFLGLRIFPGRCRLSARSRKRFRRKLVGSLAAHQRGELSDTEFQNRAQALVAFTRHAQAWQFRRRVLQGLAFGERS